MKILLVEPFFTGSHQSWAESLGHHSRHSIDLLTLPGRHWKWRMHGGAISLARKYREKAKSYDLILATDMLDLPAFIAHAGIDKNRKTAIYFHENQLTYPWSPNDEDLNHGRDNHYSFINYSSALIADYCLFNSEYHKNIFIKSLSDFLNQFPDHRDKENIRLINKKSSVLHLGLELKELLNFSRIKNKIPVLLWNHRWEYDKNPDDFYIFITELKKIRPFKLIVTGERYKSIPPIFNRIEHEFEADILHFGYCERKENYYDLLGQSDFLPVTSNQDFFGGSVIEAMAAGCIPILPNRLTYPEHLSAKLREALIYNSRDEAIDIIVNLIDCNTVNVQEVRNQVKKYTWEKMILKYDDIFEKLIIKGL